MLIQRAKTIVTSPVAVVTLTGINTSNLYLVTFTGVTWQTNDDLRVRLTVGGSVQTNAEYDAVAKILYTDVNFGNLGNANGTSWDLNQGNGTTGANAINGIYQLGSMIDTNTFSQATFMGVGRNSSQNRSGGYMGGAVRTELENNDGISFFGASDNNFATGTWCLYEVLE